MAPKKKLKTADAELRDRLFGDLTELPDEEIDALLHAVRPDINVAQLVRILRASARLDADMPHKSRSRARPPWLKKPA